MEITDTIRKQLDDKIFYQDCAQNYEVIEPTQEDLNSVIKNSQDAEIVIFVKAEYYGGYQKLALMVLSDRVEIIARGRIERK